MSPLVPYVAPTAPRLPDVATLPAIELPLPTGPLGRTELSDGTLRGVSLANEDLSRSHWRVVQVSRARLTGVRLDGATLTDVVFDECLLDLSALSEARLERVAFEACRLAGADLQHLQARDVCFSGCDLTEVDLSGATFARSAMFGCTLDGARGMARLRGVGMRANDVVAASGAFASELGIRLVD
jgi:uncharacterized protein YjbI with pentapeptide repeats